MAPQGSAGVPLVRGTLALALALASHKLVVAERAAEALDDATSLMQVTRQFSSMMLQVDDAAPCIDPLGVQDAYGTDCLYITANPSMCSFSSSFADSDFTAEFMCCGCMDTPSPTPPQTTMPAPLQTPSVAPTAAPTATPTATPTAGVAPTPAPEPCVDTAPPGAQDFHGNTCAHFEHSPSDCQGILSGFADSDFSPYFMCCACTDTPSPTPPQTPSVAPTATPSATPTATPSAGVAPTPAPSASPTTNPTASLTAAPTQLPTPGGGASATGDPHVSNVDGIRFNIMKSGVHEFLRLPRRANGSRGFAQPRPLLAVLATVERTEDDECRESYLKQVYVVGDWLRLSGPLRFRAAGSGLNDARAIAVSVNGTSLDKDAFRRHSAALPFLEVLEPVPHAARAPDRIQKVPMLTVRLSFAAATLKVDWMHRAVPGAPAVNHLNFQAFGLRRFLDGAGMDIGGILGRDDHSDAASLPAQCKESDADLRVSSKENSEASDLQVITAAL